MSARWDKLPTNPSEDLGLLLLAQRLHCCLLIVVYPIGELICNGATCVCLAVVEHSSLSALKTIPGGLEGQDFWNAAGR